MQMNDLVRRFKTALNRAGATPPLDDKNPRFGPKTEAIADQFEIEIVARRIKPVPEEQKARGVPTDEADPFWLDQAKKKYQGKNENDPAFNKQMSSRWGLVRLRLKTIAANWAAWCGLFAAVVFADVGIRWQLDGAAARNWGKYGTEIEWKQNGIPRGAVLWLNHKGNCKSGSGNHVTFADASCTAQDLAKAGAGIPAFGGNQGNTAKVSRYGVKEICGVRWPDTTTEGKVIPFPGPVAKSTDSCTLKKASGESTR